MNALIAFLIAHGLMLAAGATALLLLAAAALAVTRSPAHRQRLAEAGILAAAVWLVLACVPMQRWRLPATFQEQPPSPHRQLTPMDLRYDQPPLEIPPELLVASQPQPRSEPNDMDAAPVMPASITWPAQSPPPGIDWPRVAATVFLCGTAVSLAWLGLGHVVMWRMLRRAAAPPAWISAIVREVLPEGAAEPHVRVIPGLARPASVGAWRPLILLPKGLAREGAPARVRQVILHELGHVLRRDGVGNALFNLVLPVLWFHPAYWWLRSQSSLARERVADDWAATFDGKEAYVAELVELARGRLSLAAPGPAAAIGIFGRGSDFFRRMRMLLQSEKPLPIRCSKGWRGCLAGGLLVSVCVAAGYFGVEPAQAQDAPAKPTAAPQVAQPGAAAQSAASNPPAAAQSTATAKPAESAAKAAAPGGELVDVFSATPVGEKPYAVAEADAEMLDPRLRDEIAMLREQREDLMSQLKALDSDIAKLKAKDDVTAKELHDKRAQALARRSELEAKLADMQDKINEAGLVQRKYKAAKDAYARTFKTSKVRAYGELEPDAAATPAEGAAGGYAPAAGWSTKTQPGGRGRFGGTSVTAELKTPTAMGRGGYGVGGDESAPAAANVPGGRAGVGAGAGGGMGIGGVQLDLVNLANSVADAGEKVRVARAQLAFMQARGAPDVATAEASYEGARKRLELLRGIAKLALVGAARDLDRYRQLARVGDAPEAQIVEREAKLQMLELIVSSANEGVEGEKMTTPGPARR